VDGKEQNNTMLYIVVLVGLVIIGVLQGVFGSMFGIYTPDSIASVIVTEVIGAALLFGLMVFIIQRVTAPYQSLADKMEVLGNEQDRLRGVQEKMLANTQPTRGERNSKSSMDAYVAPTPVAATPTPTPQPAKPAAPPKDPIEAQLEEVIGDIHFDDMFADYQAKRNQALASGKGISDDEDGGPGFITD
jgi:hypothetical protein